MSDTWQDPEQPLEAVARKLHEAAELMSGERERDIERLQAALERIYGTPNLTLAEARMIALAALES